MQTFAKPLSAYEEKTFLRQYGEGNPEMKDILVERNLRLVAHVVKKYQGAMEDMEDLISIGTIGLIKAIQTFDTKKNIRLASYASKCIENEILMYLRKRKKTQREVSLYETIGTDKEGNEIHLLDVIDDDSADLQEEYFKKEDIRKLYQLLDTVLSEQERSILRMRYGLYGTEPKTQREIAAIQGISRSYVSRIEKNAVLKLRPYLI
ncbi:MAG: RNA polymerase sporulation sigma factor SigK [Lachnospiraceae bacterium]|nr:RNA polymerase sporulation sigma factor SigK [Lachnospiraceae bacterium]